MKLNNKGFAISTIMYIILIFALVLILSILGMLSSRKMILDKIKNKTISEVKNYINAEKQYQVYHIGDIVKYKDIEFYVLSESSEKRAYITLLKKEPLLYSEISEYNSGVIENSDNTYGYIAYAEQGKDSTYDFSIIKEVINRWASDKLAIDDLKIVGNYNSRLIYDTEFKSLYENHDWIYSDKYYYWTMSSGSNQYNTLIIGPSGILSESSVINKYAVRPVINLYKDAIN